ncbi:T9SS type A sorting domain-containing protein [candidate division KSB1 bacterium]|nr:T9SS type A sorting domain-containing protein [candidate division KSB1 bacterium]
MACPNALNHGNFTYFNAGGGFEELTNGTDDIGFISALIDTMIKNYDIDTARIYVMGFSNGSAMSYRVAAELSDKIAGIGAVSGQMTYEYCNPKFPVPIIHFHGLSDNFIPYEGNESNIPSVESIMEIWRGINNCSPIPDTIYNEPGIIGKKWTSFDGKSDIELYTIQDQEHEWPRTATLGISATDVIWDFLKVHNRSSVPNIEAKQFMYDGEMRTYLVYDPSPNSGGRPLVIGLHCHSGTAQGLLTYTDLLQKAQKENFIGVFPNGLFHPIGTAWNVGSSFEQFTRGTADVGFISALIDTMIKNYDVDTSRVYATGHSNGSMMSYRLAAELSHRIAAIGCVAAPMLYEFADPEFSVPIIHFHGLSDTTAPYEGKVKSHVTFPHMDSTLTTWRKINDCSSTPEIIMDENGILGKKWPSSDGKGDIVLFTIETCMHDWPVYEKYGIGATDAIWDYFELHTKNIETHINASQRHVRSMDFKLYQNYPNPFNQKTIIRYKLPIDCHVELKIFNTLGQEVITLVDEEQKSGFYDIDWQATTNNSGLYFYSLKTKSIKGLSFEKSIKMLYIK